MAANDKKLIVVAGATGAQGGSVVRFLQQDGKYKIRGLTRDTTSEKSKALAAKGVEVVAANLKSKEELKNALQGAYGFFALTNFWDPDTMGKEVEIGRTEVEAAKEAGVQHFIWSSLANVKEISNGKYDVPHFTDKAEVEKIALAAGFKYTTFVGPSFYFSNFKAFFPPKEENGTLVFTFAMAPTDKLAAFDVEDTGEAVVSAFNHPGEWNQKQIALFGDNMQVQEYVRLIGEAAGKPAKLNSITPEVFGSFGFPGAHEMANMLGYFSEFGYFGNWDLSTAKRAAPHLKSFEAYLKLNGY